MMKNKQFLTTSNLVSPRIGLCLGVSALLLLGGCSLESIGTGSISGAIYGDGNSSYEGGIRRVPVLNQSSSGVSVKSPKKPDDSKMNTPYDQYDANGDRSGNADDTSTVGGISNFFTDFVAGESVKQAPQNGSSPVVRKPLLGNPYVPKSLQSKASQPESPMITPLVDMEIEEEGELSAVAPALKSSADNVSEQKTIVEPSIQQPSSDVAMDKDISVESEGEGFFDKITSYFSTSDDSNKNGSDDAQKSASAVMSSAEIEEDELEEFEKVEMNTQQRVVSSASPVQEPEKVATQVPVQEAVKAQEAESSVGNVSKDSVRETELGHIAPRITIIDYSADEVQPLYPQVSSVPPKPEEFEAVKKEQQQNLEELKSEGGVAQQGKEALEAEVSGGVVASGSVLEQSPVVLPIVEGKEFPPEEKNMSDKSVPVADEDEPSLFGKIQSFFDSSSEDNSSGGAVPVAGEVIEDLDDDLDEEGVVGGNAVPLIVEEKPASASAVPEPSAIGGSSEVSPVQKTDGGAVDNNASSLPSPDIIKTMRPSRYEGVRSKTNSAY